MHFLIQVWIDDLWQGLQVALGLQMSTKANHRLGLGRPWGGVCFWNVMWLLGGRLGAWHSSSGYELQTVFGTAQNYPPLKLCGFEG